MPRRRRGTKPKKWTLRKQLVLFLGVPLLLCVALFIAMDSLTTYWFVLFNNDDDVEARRREDFSWYDNYGQQTVNKPGSAAAPGYTDKNVGTNDPAEVLKLVRDTLTDAQMQEGHTALRFWIYFLDNKGYVPNATIGALSCMNEECGLVDGGGMGSWTYESYWVRSRLGPDGQYKSHAKDNAGWLKWLDTYNSKGGLGIAQWTDTTYGDRATQLIEKATEANTYWQDPAFQIPYLFTEIPDDLIWNTRMAPGVDPKSSTEVTAAEWCKRYYMMERHGGYQSYTTYDFTTGDPKDRLNALESAAILYEQYSGKDPWFYNSDGSQIYSPTPGMSSGSGYIWGDDPCPACNQIKADDWHCPFCGPVYDNSTPQGLLIARVALLNAIDKRTSGWVFPSNGAMDFTTAALNDSRVNNYRITIRNFGRTDHHAADCCSGVQAMVRLSGVDTAMPKCGTLLMEAYLWDKKEDVWFDSSGWRGSSKNNGAWEYIGVAKNVQLQPGDILIMNTDYPYEGGTGHIQIYVGENVAGERWDGTTARIAQASQNQYYWDMCNSYDNSYRVFRSTAQCPYDNITNWNTFKSQYRVTFSVDYPG